MSRGILYFYVKNLQGDIIGLVDVSGNTVVEYTYDSWGKLLSITGSLKDSVGVQNPFRYRGYYYDTETGLYYLQSRYCDPEIRRFISADSLINSTMLGANVYCYCENNPVNRFDPDGHWSLTATFTIIAAAVSVAFGGAVANTPAVKQKTKNLGNAISQSIARKKQKVKSTFSSIQNSYTVTTIQDTLTDIAGRFGNFECDKSAEAMMIALKKKRRHGKKIIIQYSGMGNLNNVWSESRQMVISQTGMHCGIVYEELVYCNVHPQGLPEEVWLDDFVGLGIRNKYYLPF